MASSDSRHPLFPLSQEPHTFHQRKNFWKTLCSVKPHPVGGSGLGMVMDACS